MEGQIIVRANLYIYNGKSKQVKVISNTYMVKSDLYRYISDTDVSPFFKLMSLYDVYVMYKILVQLLFLNHFLSFFTFQFVISHMAIESTFTTNSIGESCPVCHSVAM